MRRNTPESFWRRTESDGPCLVWTGGRSVEGYGVLSWENRQVKAHRLAFFLRLGYWPEGLLRHLCNRPECILHAVEGTPSENGLDAVAAGSHPKSRRTHCPQGHEYDEANTTWHRRHRHCKACGRDRARAKRRRLASA